MIRYMSRYIALVLSTIGLVRQRMKSGKTIEQIQAEGLPEKWNSWGAGFVNTKTWINIVYQSLSKPASCAPALGAHFKSSGGGPDHRPR